MLKLKLQLFAIDEEPDGPISNESNITDLTGYTWVGSNYINIPFNVNTYNINFTSNNINYTSITLNGSQNSIQYNSTYVNMDEWLNEAYKTITITGGSDVTSSALIFWLEANGTLTAPQPAQNDKIFIGTSALSKAFLGDTELASVWLGNIKLY